MSVFYTFDAQGGVAQRLDNTGGVLSSHQFTAHGVELTAPSADPFGYGAQWGYYTDRETGLQFLTHRYYDPNAGRFITRDPISYRGGINLYAYVKNNPPNGADPNGLLTVYIWNYRGSNDAWGHASITLEDGTHISWWPNTPQADKTGPIYTAPAREHQSLQRDRDFEGQPPDEEIHIDGLDESAIKDWWEKFRKENKWKTLSQNCSTTVADALMSGGAWPRANIIWTPEDILDYAKFLQQHPRKPKFDWNNTDRCWGGARGC